MRNRTVRTARLGTSGLVALGFAGVASWALGLGAPPSTPPEISPAELIALRFLEVEFAQPLMHAETAVAPVMALASVDSRSIDVEMLDPRPSMPLTTGSINPAPLAEAKPAPKAMSVPLPLARPAQAPQALAKARANTRPGSVLNDAQIAGIRKRLKLTPDQEEMWPAVEAALRNIAYKKSPNGTAHGGSQTAYVDPDSDEVQRLKSVAFPLIMRLNDEQKREVKMLAHVMGLSAVASRL